ncbi:MAG TPA: M55 family metallopeptidase [Phycisphaerae bacterium]|nr:M55 family metallopeptidase [Phycisphaerae bacterium]
MKIYIMTDLEGLSGVEDGSYIPEESPFFQDARRYLMGDVNAAIAGCFDGGADQVVVKDGHYRGVNFILDRLDPRAVQDFAAPQWTGVLDESFDATMMIGQHAMAGTLDGFLCHTMSSASWWEYSINGRPHGELGMWATIAGHYDVPLIFVAGDRGACDEARQFIEGITAVSVKQGRGRQRALCTPVTQAQAEIREGAKQAVKNIGNVKPYKIDLPATVQLIYQRAEMADDAASRPEVERVDARTIRRTAESALDIML